MKIENLLYSNEFKVEIEDGERIADLVKCVHFDFGKGEVRITFYETKQLDVLKFLQEWIDRKDFRNITIWMGDGTRGIKLKDCVVFSFVSLDDLGNTLFEYDEEEIEESQGYIVEVAVLLKFSKFEIVEKNSS
jgi:hypothetical protein